MTLQSLRKEIRAAANPAKAAFHQRFFKTGPGEYAEGDIFLGITVPRQRALARPYRHLPLRDIATLLTSQFHEERLIALIILSDVFPKADPQRRAEIFRFYMKHLDHINNWDLIDCSAPNVVGAYLYDRADKKILYRLAKSSTLWRRRVAIMATFYFLRRDDYSHTLQISALLLQDEHDLIHKAVGWALREVGKRRLATEVQFLKKHYRKMPRTMLRYAIEKFPEKTRKAYLRSEI